MSDGSQRPLRAIIFDWGRTLHDSDHAALFPEAARVVEQLSARYTLAIVALITRGDVEAGAEERCAILRASDLERHFSALLFAPADKDSLYAPALGRLRLSPREAAIVDDRVIRGIRWGNRAGATTIWLRRGKFAQEVPDEETGAPTHTIADLGQLLDIL